MEKQFKNKYLKYKSKYLKLQKYLQKGGVRYELDSGASALTEGCYVYLAHPDGKKLSVDDGMPINKWYYDWYGKQEDMSCDNERRNKYQSDYKPDYGTLIVNVPAPTPAPELKYDRETGVISDFELSQITNLPSTETAKIKSAMVWGALNRARDKVPGLSKIEDKNLINYITNNEIIEKKDTNREKACEFVKAYVKLSENESFINQASTLLDGGGGGGAGAP